MSDREKLRWQSDLALIADAAKEAGAVAYGFFNQSPEVWWKNGDRSPVSAADFAANKTLETILRKARPDYGWLSEETEDDAGRLSRETLFIVDPIDGTRAFLGGQKVWCVSVAVVHRGRPVAGVLYAPALEEFYEAVDGGVALKNGMPFTVSAAGPDELSRLAIGEDLLKTFPPASVTASDARNMFPRLPIVSPWWRTAVSKAPSSRAIRTTGTLPPPISFWPAPAAASSTSKASRSSTTGPTSPTRSSVPHRRPASMSSSRPLAGDETVDVSVKIPQMR